MSDEKRCPVCGRCFDASTGRTGGRPRVYCSDRCKEIASLLGRLGRLVEELAAECSEVTVELAALRGAAFRIANLINRIGRPVKGANPRPDKTRAGWRGLRP